MWPWFALCGRTSLMDVVCTASKQGGCAPPSSSICCLRHVSALWHAPALPAAWLDPPCLFLPMHGTWVPPPPLSPVCIVCTQMGGLATVMSCAVWWLSVPRVVSRGLVCSLFVMRRLSLSLSPPPPSPWCVKNFLPLPVLDLQGFRAVSVGDPQLLAACRLFSLSLLLASPTWLHVVKHCRLAKGSENCKRAC